MHSNQLFTKLLLSGLAALTAGLIQAQTLTSSSLDRDKITLGESAVIHVNGKVEGQINFCGLHVDWGDGRISHHKINRDTPFPGKYDYAYNKPGIYTVRVIPGKVTTHYPCQGSSTTQRIEVMTAGTSSNNAVAPVNVVPAPAPAPAASPLLARATAGEVAAQLELAKNYESARNTTEAARWYQAAAEQNNAEAANNLGMIFYKSQKPGDAAKWFKRAADAAYPPALNNLGFLYSQGTGVIQDLKEAAKFYEKAAVLGNSDGLNNYADYLGGNAKTETENVTAYAWLNVAAAREGDASKRTSLTAKRDAIKARLNPAALTRGTAQSADLDKKLAR